jgi:poly(A) polymerase
LTVVTVRESLERLAAIAQPVAEAFQRADFSLYLVGGSVRDAVLAGLTDQVAPDAIDLDFTTNARPDDIARLLQPLCRATWDMGRAFGTIGGELKSSRRKVEITTFRSESYVTDSRKPQVAFGDTLEGDLARRDFTINAIAFDPLTNNLVDPHQGLEHLMARQLITPIDPVVLFTDDPLRMLRAARFATRFDLTIDPAITAAATQLAERLTIVSPERVRGELDLLLQTARPSTGLDFIVRTGLATHFLPELPALALEQDPIHHHKDVLTHTYAVVEKTDPTHLVVRLAALLHDIGKPRTRAFGENGVTFHGHDHVGARMTRKRMEALQYSREMIDDVSKLVELHLRFHTYAMGWSDSAVRRYVRDAGPLLDALNELTRCDCTTRNKRKAAELDRRMDELEARIADLRHQEDLDALRPALDGDQIMALLEIPPSRAVGEALSFLMEIRMEEGVIDPADAARRVQAWWRERSAL